MRAFLRRHNAKLLAGFIVCILTAGTAWAARFYQGTVTITCCAFTAKNNTNTGAPFTLPSANVSVYCDNSVGVRICNATSCAATANDWNVPSVTQVDIDSPYAPANTTISFISQGTDAGFSCKVYTRAPAQTTPGVGYNQSGH